MPEAPAGLMLVAPAPLLTIVRLCWLLCSLTLLDWYCTVWGLLLLLLGVLPYYHSYRMLRGAPSIASGMAALHS